MGALTPEQQKQIDDKIAELEAKVKDLANQGKSEDNPVEDSDHPLLHHGERAMQGFADDASIADLIHAKGFTGAKKNKAGDWVAQDPATGDWHKDNGGLLAGAERHLGEVPVVGGAAVGAPVGAAIGGSLGGLIGAGSSGPAGLASGVVGGGTTGAIAGEGVGAGAGEALREWLGKKLGVRKDDVNMGDVATTGLATAGISGALHGLGIAGSYLPVPDVVAKKLLGAARASQGQGGNVSDLLAQIADKYAVQPAKKTVAAVAGSLSGAGSDAALRTIERPSQALSAYDDVAEKAAQAGDFLDKEDSRYGQNASRARENLRVNRGNEVVDTTPLVNKNAASMEKYAANSNNSGPMRPEELQALYKRQKGGYTTPMDTDVYEQRSVPPTSDKEKLARGLNWEFSPMEPKLDYKPGKFGGEQRLVDPVYGAPIPDASTQLLDPNLSMERVKGPTGRGTEVRSNPLNMEWTKTGTDTQYLPQQTLGHLQKEADELAKDVGPANWRKAAQGKAVDRTEPFITDAKQQYHDVKDLLHTHDPDLARADKMYSDFARNAENPDVGALSVDDKQEGAFKKLAKKVADDADKNTVDKAKVALGHSVRDADGNVVEVAKRAIDNPMDNILDMGSAMKFKTPDSFLSALKLTPRRLLQMSLGAGAVGAGATGNPELEYGLGAGAFLLEPSLIRHMLARGALSAPAAKALVRQAGIQDQAVPAVKNLWSSLRDQNKESE